MSLAPEQVRASLTAISGAASSVLLLAGTDADALITHGRFLQAKFGDPTKVHEPIQTEPRDRPASLNPLDLE